MADIVTVEQRSKNMSAIRSKNTKPEVYLRKLLFHNGFRYSLNSVKVTGHPDVFMRKYNTAVFVHGCFWHHHQGCKYAYEPKSNVEFWKDKFQRNIQRDQEVQRTLLSEGIKVLLIWECTIRGMRRSHEQENSIMNQIKQFLHCDSMFLEL